MSANLEQLLDRRALLRGLAGTTATLALVGCGSPELGMQNETLAQALPLIHEIYPAIEDDFVISSGRFTAGSVQTDWYNLTSFQYQPAASIAVFNYFYQLADNQTTLSYSLQGQQTSFRLTRRDTAERIILLVPQEAPPPPWPGINPSLDIGIAATTLFLTQGPGKNITTTFIAIPNSDQVVEKHLAFNTQQLAFFKSFAVEACQSSISVKSTDIQNTQIGQELVCNSIGAALALRPGHSYQDYLDWIKAVPYYLDAQTKIPDIIVPENQFNSMPVIQPFFHS